MLRLIEFPPRRPAAALLVVIFCLAALLAFSGSASAQLDSNCQASLLNRTVDVGDDGFFIIPNVPVERGRFRVRVACTPEGGEILEGQSQLFEFEGEDLVETGPIAFGMISGDLRSPISWTPVWMSSPCRSWPGMRTRRQRLGTTGGVKERSGKRWRLWRCHARQRDPALEGRLPSLEIGPFLPSDAFQQPMELAVLLEDHLHRFYSCRSESRSSSPKRSVSHSNS